TREIYFSHFWRLEVQDRPADLGSALVCFHAVDKDISQTGQFTKEKGLIGLTVPRGWGSLTIMQECKEKQVTSYMDGSKQRERTCAGKLFLKPSDLKSTAMLRYVQWRRAIWQEIEGSLQTQ
uniref:Uncharacterized protein n=1 Tax=Callithrix jacchus TaxID=9483 RepID=A0A8I4A3U0_CALJA